MSFMKNVNPAGAIEDFISVYKSAGKHRWRFMAVAAAITFTLFGTMAQERMMIPPERPEITVIETLAPGRSDAEIVASNIANQERKDRLAKEQAERDEKVRDIYRTLGEMSGMDVEKIEQQAEAERAAIRARQEEARRILAERQAKAFDQVGE